MSLFVLIFFCAHTPEESKTTPLQEKEPDKQAAIYHFQATSYYQQGKFDSAIEFYKKSISVDSNFIEAYIGLGNSYLAKQLPDSAKKIFEFVVKNFPLDSRGYEGLGFLWGFYKKDYEKGKGYYNKALSLKPDDLSIFFNLASLAENYNKEEADSLYRTLLEKNPEHRGALKRYFLLLVKEKKYQKVVEFLPKIEELFGKDIEVIQGLVDVYLNDKNYKKAIEFIEPLIQNYPQSYELFIKRGEINAGLRNYAAAIADFEKAIQLAPKEPLPYIKKADIYLKIGDYYKAIEIAKGILSFSFSNNDLKAATYVQIGDSYKGIAEIHRDKYRKTNDKNERDISHKEYKNAISWYEKTKHLGKSVYYSYADAQIKICEEEIRKLLGISP